VHERGRVVIVKPIPNPGDAAYGSRFMGCGVWLRGWDLSAKLDDHREVLNLQLFGEIFSLVILRPRRLDFI